MALLKLKSIKTDSGMFFIETTLSLKVTVHKFKISDILTQKITQIIFFLP